VRPIDAKGLAALLAAGLVLVACGSGNDETGQNLARGAGHQAVPRQDDLLGRAFRSTAVTEDSEPRPLVPNTHITVTFDERADEGGVGWQAGCNTFGADVEISADSLVVGQIAGTEIGCPDDLQQQDEWLVDFFGSDPEWQLSHDRLSLTSHDTVIELEEKALSLRDVPSESCRELPSGGRECVRPLERQADG